MMERILIVDDVQSILFAMKMYFMAYDYEVDCAKDVEEAKSLLEKSDYRIVITDLCLTGINQTEGIDLVAYIRAKTPLTRTIILTAYGSPESERVAFDVGVDAFLRKPKRLPDLAQIVMALLDESIKLDHRQFNDFAYCN
jgi:two-component system response regulator PilR (NtrC family)